MKFSRETELAINAAKQAGEAILKIYNTKFDTQFKLDQEPITRADTDSEKIIRQILQESGLPILSEERADDLERLKSNKVWIVDPLDGTSDFVERTGEFSVMIGLVDSHVPVAGIIYQPVGEVLYAAEKGRGAYQCKDGTWAKLSVSLVGEMSQARAIMSKHHLSAEDKEILEKLGVHSYVQHGSAGLKAVAVAKGEAELYFTSTDKIKQWDTCAAYCLVTEAGGRMTDMLGSPLVYNTEKVNHEYGVLISNGNFTDQLAAIYRKLNEQSI